ncbi:putative ABC transport system permease protein [Paraburkholderia sp. JPY465]|uniref:ABC transporter permease n=1 Tax=Paraburkholderia sp. JPY465 TaxID=3042285 RepID=UPI003D247877
MRIQALMWEVITTMNEWMECLRRELKCALGFAWQSVKTSRRRVVLAVVGVAIGIAAVASMLIIGNSVTTQATKALDRLGADVVTIAMLPASAEQSDRNGRPLSESESARLNAATASAEVLLRLMPEVQSVVRLERRYGCGDGPATALGSPDIVAANPDLPSALSLRLQQGRFLSPVDAGQPWIVLGADIAVELRRTSFSVQLGGPLNLCGKTFFLAGVLTSYFGDSLLQSLKIDHSVFISYPSLHRLAGPASPSASLLLTRVRAGTTAPDMPATLSARLRGAFPQTVEASGARQVSELRQRQTLLYTRFLAVLGGVTLLVGSLGIVNVMLASISERKEEIGLRMALGARVNDVVMQFLMESLLICLFGAALGLTLGTAGAYLALTIAGIDVTLDFASPAYSVGLALLCGLAAGAYPAATAARVDPVTMLQRQA